MLFLKNINKIRYKIIILKLFSINPLKPTPWFLHKKIFFLRFYFIYGPHMIIQKKFFSERYQERKYLFVSYMIHWENFRQNPDPDCNPYSF